MEFVLFWLFVLYLAPFLVATVRGHHAVVPILVLDLALAWTGIGWLLLLVFAARSEPQRPPPSLEGNVVSLREHRRLRATRHAGPAPTRPGQLIALHAVRRGEARRDLEA